MNKINNNVSIPRGCEPAFNEQTFICDSKVSDKCWLTSFVYIQVLGRGGWICNKADILKPPPPAGNACGHLCDREEYVRPQMSSMPYYFGAGITRVYDEFLDIELYFSSDGELLGYDDHVDQMCVSMPVGYYHPLWNPLEPYLTGRYWSRF